MRWLRVLIFQLERFILKGATFQLLLIGGLILLVSRRVGGQPPPMVTEVFDPGAWQL